MPRNTAKDRNFKKRLHEREYKQTLLKIKLIQNISEPNRNLLKSIVAMSARGEVVTTAAIDNWRELRLMGAISEKDGQIRLTTVGREIAADQDRA